jgi:hypothetical protein
VGRGDFFLRLGPEKLDLVRKAAEAEGLSVSDFIREGIEMRLNGGSRPSSAGRRAALRELAHVLSRLDSGFVLVPAAEVPGPSPRGSSDPWTDFLDGGKP